MKTKPKGSFAVVKKCPRRGKFSCVGEAKADELTRDVTSETEEEGNVIGGKCCM